MSSFIVFAMLARLLDPVAFGIFALSTIFVDVARTLSNAGLPDAIMREPDLTEELADTAFWANVLFSFIVMMITLLVAQPYAVVMGQPLVRPVIMVLALLMPVAALGSIHTARLQREFGHKALSVRTMVATLIASIGAVLAAWLGAGVWSLVIQAALIDVMQLALAFYTYRWRPKLRFSLSSLRILVGFSSSMVVTQLSWLILIRIPELFIGHFLGAAAVGRYRISWRLIDLLGQAVLTPMSSVSLITLAKVQKEAERFSRIYRLLVSGAALVALPMLFGLGALADDLIPAVFGGKWQGNGALVRILTLMALPFTINYFVSPALAAVGRSRAIMRVALVQLVATLLVSALSAPYGLLAIAAAYVGRAYVTLPYQLGVLQKHTGISASGVVRGALGPLLGAAVMALAVFFLRGELLALGWTQTMRLLTLIPLGAVLYAALVMLVARDRILDIIQLLLPGVGARLIPSSFQKKAEIHGT